MKILAIQPGPAFSVQDVYAGWCEALRDLGQKVARYNLDARLSFYAEALLPTGQTGDEGVEYRRALTPAQAVDRAIAGVYEQLYLFQPDVLLIVSGFFVPPELCDRARERGVQVVLIHTEEPYEHDRGLSLAEHVDLNLINDPLNLEAYRAIAPTWYVPHAYRPSVHKPGPALPQLVCDLGFVGTGYPSRIAFLEAMGLADLDVVLSGNWQALGELSPLRAHVGHEIGQCLDNTDAVDLYRSMRCGLNLYRREVSEGSSPDGLAMGPREVEMAACGAFFLREPRAEGDEVLHMFPTFTGPDEATEQLRWYLGRPAEREQLAIKARQAIAERTFTNHAKALLPRLVEGKR